MLKPKHTRMISLRCIRRLEAFEKYFQDEIVGLPEGVMWYTGHIRGYPSPGNHDTRDADSRDAAHSRRIKRQIVGSIKRPDMRRYYELMFEREFVYNTHRY